MMTLEMVMQLAYFVTLGQVGRVRPLLRIATNIVRVM